MRVAFVLDTLNVGGSEQSLWAIASRFQRYEPHFVTCYPGAALLDQVETTNQRVHALDVPGPYNWNKVVPRLREVLRANQIDVVVATLFRAEVASRLALSRRAPLLGTFVNESYATSRAERLSARGRLKLELVRAIDMITLPLCDGFIANSDAVARANADALRVPLSSIEVIHRGRDASLFPRLLPEARAAVRAAHGWSDDVPVILNVARMLERKGQLDLLSAFPRVLQQAPRARLVFVGDGPLRSTLHAMALELGVEDNVELLGTRGDVADLLGACDVFAFPSYFEGHSGAVLEAMFCGCAIAASDIAANRESVVDGESARMFPVGDPSAIADALIALINDPGAARKLGDEAQRVARDRFDLGVVAAKHEALFDDVIARAHR